jgi:hypothetical protein
VTSYSLRYKFELLPLDHTKDCATLIDIKVPSGATTGFVTVMNAKHKLKSNKKFHAL